MTYVDPTKPELLTFSRSMALESELRVAAYRQHYARHGQDGALVLDSAAPVPEGFDVIGYAGLSTKIIARDGRCWAWPWHDPEVDPGWDEADFRANYPFREAEVPELT